MAEAAGKGPHGEEFSKLTSHSENLRETSSGVMDPTLDPGWITQLEGGFFLSLKFFSPGTAMAYQELDLGVDRALTTP